MHATTLSAPRARVTKLPCSIQPGKSALERHGIDHLSASSLNAWIASPALWIMNRLIGRWGDMGCAAHRGQAVEAGFSLALFGDEVDEGAWIGRALEVFDDLAAASRDPKRDDERARIPAMVREASRLAFEKTVPDAPDPPHKQHRIVARLEGVPVPLIGFLDFRWPGEILDLKTTTRIPSTWSDAHRRQAALYNYAHPNHTVSFYYVSEKRSSTLTLTPEDAAIGVRELTHAARRLERFLLLSNDPHELAQLVTPDWGSFYWSDEATRRLGQLTFGY